MCESANEAKKKCFNFILTKSKRFDTVQSLRSNICHALRTPSEIDDDGFPEKNNALMTQYAHFDSQSIYLCVSVVIKIASSVKHCIVRKMNMNLAHISHRRGHVSMTLVRRLLFGASLCSSDRNCHFFWRLLNGILV